MAFDASILKPRVPEQTAVPVTFAAALVLDATKGHRFTTSATGNITGVTATGGYDGQVIILEVTASGAGRTVTLTQGANGFNPTDAVTLGAATTVASGKIGFFSARWNASISRWVPISIFQTT